MFVETYVFITTLHHDVRDCFFSLFFCIKCTYMPWKVFLVPKPNIKLLLSYTDFYRMEFAFYAQVVKETQQSAQDCKEKKLTLVRFTR